jgi:hypothetical protein
MFMEYVIPAFNDDKEVSWLEPKWLKMQINRKI